MFPPEPDPSSRPIPEFEKPGWRTETRYRTLFETSRDGILIFDREGHFVDFNQSFCRALKASQEQLLGASFGQFVPSDRSADAEALLNDLRSGQSTPLEFPMRSPDGEIVEFEWTSATGSQEDLCFCVCRDITRRKRSDRERRQAKTHLSEAETQLRLITDSLPVLISYVDSEGRYRFNNKTYEVWFGQRRDEIYGRHVREVIGEDAYRRVEPHMQAVLRGEPQYFEEYLAYRDQRSRYVTITYVPDENAGSVRGYFALIEDVTERKLAEEKLEASEDLFRRIVETAAEGIWIIDGETRTTFTNRRMAEMLGYAPSDLIGRSCFEFIHPDDIDRGRDGFEKRKQGDTAPREYRAYRSDGSIIWISFTASPMKDEQGNLTGVLGMCTDISQRKRTEEALIQNEMRYRLVARATNDAIWDWDLENDHIVWNEAVETLFGHSMESVSHDSAWWLDRVHAEDRERVSRRLHQVIDGSGENWSEEYRFKRADGSYAAVYDRGYLLRNREGKPVRMIGSMLDVTERKRAEEALQKSNEALRRMNENLRQFAYAASHDLREPLRMVSIYSQLLSKRYKGKLDEDADTFLGFTEQGAKRMQLLLDDLLAFSQAGDTRDKPIEPVDCNSAVHMALQNLKRAIEENSAVVTADPLPIVQAHLSHLIQVFQNLIGNALKYRGEEVPRVHISAGSRERDWIFYVRDNGIGIDAKYHKLIFGLFKRLHHPEAHPGTGIGLSICARVVERYGGHIWVESEHGKGSTFCFTIPKKVE